MRGARMPQSIHNATSKMSYLEMPKTRYIDRVDE
jgi:hypothetical protein